MRIDGSLPIYLNECMTMEECIRWARHIGIPLGDIDKIVLEALLADAVEKEEYERAAVLRDGLRGLGRYLE